VDRARIRVAIENMLPSAQSRDNRSTARMKNSRDARRARLPQPRDRHRGVMVVPIARESGTHSADWRDLKQQPETIPDYLAFVLVSVAV
jgi:hypothetical protein